MSKEHLPLCDGELDALVREIEAEGLIPAPPGMEEAVLAKIAARPAPRPKRSPAAELWRYSLQVSAAVAAAIFLLFTAPSWDTIRAQVPQREESGWLETLFSPREAGREAEITQFDHDGGVS